MALGTFWFMGLSNTYLRAVRKLEDFLCRGQKIHTFCQWAFLDKYEIRNASCLNFLTTINYISQRLTPAARSSIHWYNSLQDTEEKWLWVTYKGLWPGTLVNMSSTPLKLTSVSVTHSFPPGSHVPELVPSHLVTLADQLGAFTLMGPKGHSFCLSWSWSHLGRNSQRYLVDFLSCLGTCWFGFLLGRQFWICC